MSDGRALTLAELMQEAAAIHGRSLRRLPIPESLIRGMMSMTGRSSVVERLTGSLTVVPDKIRNVLGWRPPFGLSESLARTLNAHSALRSAA
ncbi:MAG: hypothetical protein QM775_36155 [Pirellulales bacterium]